MNISIRNCRIENSRAVVIPEISWKMSEGEAWLVTGPNGGGKADFLKALAGELRLVPNVEDHAGAETVADATAAVAEVCLPEDVELVSLERAARLIQEERENDESEYTEGGVDIGRTGRLFIMQGLYPNLKKGSALPAEAARLEAYPAVKLCGVEGILDRGLKYMSTGEIRRTLLTRALVSGKKLLVLSDPFAGLDVQSRAILLDFFNSIASRQKPAVILAMERWHEIPDAITHVLEFTDKKTSFCGTRSEYEKLLAVRAAGNHEEKKKTASDFSSEYEETVRESFYARNVSGGESEYASGAENTCAATSAEGIKKGEAEILVEMHDVKVGWDGKYVLDGLNWTLRDGEHWLVRGPNGSGKTTFLELITGDNMQVFSNDIRIFGNRRGSGESVWDIKKNLGIVSYRLHVEYRMLGGTSIRDVIISGFRDSIGLYGAPTDVEGAAANRWLSLGGFKGRERERFGELSYGEQRAVLILRSAVKSPKILILDEPCHGLDENYREKILQFITLICESGSTTVLHVTHDPSEVLPCEKHILELRPGENPMYKIIAGLPPYK